MLNLFDGRDSLQYCTVQHITSLDLNKISNKFFCGGMYVTHVVCVGVFDGKSLHDGKHSIPCRSELCHVNLTPSNSQVRVTGFLHAIRKRPVLIVEHIRVVNSSEVDFWRQQAAKHKLFRMSKHTPLNFMDSISKRKEVKPTTCALTCAPIRTDSTLYAVG